MTATPIEDTCDDAPGPPYTFRVTILQEGNALTAKTPGGTFPGTICGDRIQMSGSYPEGGGTTTANLELTVSADGNSVEGSDTWSWTYDAQSCGGSESLSGTRIDSVDAPCSPWCTVVDECTDASFSECMSACAEELSQAQAISSQCADAVRSQNACLAELTCVGFYAWLNEDPPDAYPCKFEDDGVVAACGGGPVCGDDTIQGTEICDGTDLDGVTCADFGFTGGTLACNATCDNFDATACAGGPPGWTCIPEYYDAADGCDCGCGVIDPDCADDTVASCEFCGEPGSCSPIFSDCPGDINSVQNWLCGS